MELNKADVVKLGRLVRGGDGSGKESIFLTLSTQIFRHFSNTCRWNGMENSAPYTALILHLIKNTERSKTLHRQKCILSI